MVLHETKAGEYLAMTWHLIWSVVCFATFCTVAAALCMLHDMPIVPLRTALLWVLSGQMFLAAGGTFWHIFGALEHKKEIRKLNS